MSFAKPTVSSRNRARTPLGSSESVDVVAAVLQRQRAGSATGGYRSRLQGRIEKGKSSERDRKRPRAPSAEYAAEVRHHAEEVRLSQQLTSDCGDAVERARQLLGRAEECSQRLSQTLNESLGRSPARLSRGGTPRVGSAGNTPSQRAGRWSGTSAPHAPPPTPAQAADGSGSWVRRLLTRSPGKSNASPVPSPPPPPHAAASTPTTKPLTPSRQQPNGTPEERSLFGRVRCSLQRLSGRMPSPPPGESPRRSRKSVVFEGSNNKDAEVTTITTTTTTTTTPSRYGTENGLAAEQPSSRGSIQYPPAPPSSAAKLSPRRSFGVSAALESARAAASPSALSSTQAADAAAAETLVQQFKAAAAERKGRQKRGAGESVSPTAAKGEKNEKHANSEEPTEETTTEETDETEEDTDGDGEGVGPDVAAVIREMPRSRAFRMLTKRNLVSYAKEHHIVLSLKSSKRELFEVARRLATNEAS